MEHVDYWLWLMLKSLYFNDTARMLLTYFDTPEVIYCLSAAELAKVADLSDKDRDLLADKSMDAVFCVKEQCRVQNIEILCFDDPRFPENLKNIPDPPYILYVKSAEHFSFQEHLMLAIVGNRIMTEYGRGVTAQLAQELSGAGFTLVSGMARGIDGVAHAAVLERSYPTVAVLGCGLDVVYPPEHKALMDAIVQCGAVVSEYPPGTAPKADHFPRRNRIISGLSEGVIVTEAPRKSGALITASHANAQGREVFAVPGDITRGHSAGCHDLIRSGATLITSGAEVLLAFEDKLRFLLKSLEKSEKQQKREQSTQLPVTDESAQRFSQYPPQKRIILQNLSIEPVTLEVLQEKTQLSSAVLSGELTLLEIEGLIKTLPGKQFVLKV